MRWLSASFDGIAANKTANISKQALGLTNNLKVVNSNKNNKEVKVEEEEEWWWYYVSFTPIQVVTRAAFHKYTHTYTHLHEKDNKNTHFCHHHQQQRHQRFWHLWYCKSQRKNIHLFIYLFILTLVNVSGNKISVNKMRIERQH